MKRIAHFRFYEELNDFLPPRRRKCAFPYELPRGASVKHAIEALGVPHTEVDLVLVNGRSVDFSYRLGCGDSVSVYPRFETFDISPLVRLRARPLRNVRLLADRHLGRLAKYLRMLGFDTFYRNHIETPLLLRVAADEERTLLTRDRSLLRRRIVTRGAFVHAERPPAQLAEVVERLHLKELARPFTRCLRCNVLLEEVAAAEGEPRLPESVRQVCERFRRCPACGRWYWEGSHVSRMRTLVGSVLRGAGGGSSRRPASGASS